MPLSSMKFAIRLSVKGFTASLIIIAALLPVLSALLINAWLVGSFNWQAFLLELGVASVTLALIAYPASYLLRWEEIQESRWDDTRHDFLHLMEQSIDSVIVSKPTGQITEFNHKTCDLTGYDNTELRNMSTMDLDVDCFLHRSPDLIKRLKNGEDIRYETIYRRKDGQKIPVECRAKLASWMSTPHFIEFVSDISYRREAEKELHLSHQALEKTRNLLEQRVAEHSSEIQKHKDQRLIVEKRFDAIQVYLSKVIDSMPSMIIALDSKHRIIQWNREAVNVTGIASEEAIGHPLGSLYPLLDKKIIKAKISNDLLSQNITFRFRQEVNRIPRDFEAVLFTIPFENQLDQGQVIRIDDVTDKLKIDETLVQTEKMLSLGGLAAGMAHEINNPLGAIMQSTQNVMRRLSNDLQRNHHIAEQNNLNMEQIRTFIEQQRIDEFLRGIIASGERAAGIVGDMLSFAKPVTTESGEVDLLEAINAAVRLSAKDYNQKKQFDFRNIEIRKTFSPNARVVHAQQNQLSQVFLNLLINAAQALANGTSDDHPPLIEIILRREADFAVIDVIDNGPGMEESVRKRVFEPFFTTKDEKTGTGLGLSVSYFIITEQLEGSLSVESQPGKGCRFTIRLPLVEPKSSDQDPHDEQIELPL